MRTTIRCLEPGYAVGARMMPRGRCAPMDRRRARLAILRDVHGSRKDDRKQDENDRIDQKRTVMLGSVNLIPLLAGRGTPKYHDHGTTGSLQSSLFIFLIQIHNGRSPRRL